MRISKKWKLKGSDKVAWYWVYVNGVSYFITKEESNDVIIV